MPELPEVETIRRQLDAKLKGQIIKSVRILKTGRETPPGQAFAKAITGKKIKMIDRRAKLIVWRFTDGSGITTHLKLTGTVILVDKNYKPAKHDRMIFQIGSHYLVWADVRQFGRMSYLSHEALEKKLSEFGPEPLTLKPIQIAELFKRPVTRNVKSALFDQTTLAGVGNIYADESLFRAKIKPTRRLGSLTADDRLRLAKAIQAVLKQAIKLKGTSAQDYVDAHGQEGKFEKFLNVYQRKSLPCKVCGTPIVRTVVAQRGTHYCPSCQK
ncbi:MAG: bifunctional DNA-formamidopyrimidine glycosylase/DNA-(apurinic or apyrimidinic site) lyase [Patescibacteria group bacterium]|jgi:formamidopyrimidine-DNA glycosylase